MTTRITTEELAARLSDDLDRVHLRSERFVVERDGEPVATLGPPDDAGGLDLSRATHARVPTQREAVRRDDPRDQAVAELLAEIEAIRRDAATRTSRAVTARSLAEIAEELADLKWPDDEFADDIEAARAAMNRPIEPPEWPS